MMAAWTQEMLAEYDPPAQPWEVSDWLGSEEGMAWSRASFAPLRPHLVSVKEDRPGSDRHVASLWSVSQDFGRMSRTWSYLAAEQEEST
jgi:hypothetical protein